MWEKVWRWTDLKMSRCERRCGHEQMWRWADVREDVREDVKMSRCERRCEDEQMWEQMWRWADVREDVREDVKVSRCERRCEDEQMWRWADVREDLKMSRCERRCEDEQMWRWADVREDVREDVKMSRCERRCEDEQTWEKMWRWEDVLQTPTIGRTLRSDALGKNGPNMGCFVHFDFEICCALQLFFSGMWLIKLSGSVLCTNAIKMIAMETKSKIRCCKAVSKEHTKSTSTRGNQRTQPKTHRRPRNASSPGRPAYRLNATSQHPPGTGPEPNKNKPR